MSNVLRINELYPIRTEFLNIRYLPSKKNVKCTVAFKPVFRFAILKKSRLCISRLNAGPNRSKNKNKPVSNNKKIVGICVLYENLGKKRKSSRIHFKQEIDHIFLIFEKKQQVAIGWGTLLPRMGRLFVMKRDYGGILLNPSEAFFCLIISKFDDFVTEFS